jgi:hypothetical protein
VDTISEGSQTVVYFECSSLDEQVAALQAKGIQFTQEPRDEKWLWREARLLDPAGNAICLYHAGENRLNPPWRVKTQATPSSCSSPAGTPSRRDGLQL